MKVFGLTGGIGSGKSHVANVLSRQHGCAVISLDDLAKDEVLAPGSEAVEEIASLWPSTVCGGVIVREELARLVFSDSEQLARLNAIVHPRAWALSDEYLRRYENSGARAVLVESALLFGSVKERAYDANIVVIADDEVRVSRLVSCRGFSADDARARIARQVSQADLMTIGDYIIDNSGSLENFEHLIEKMWAEWMLPLVDLMA